MTGGSCDAKNVFKFKYYKLKFRGGKTRCAISGFPLCWAGIARR